MKWFVLVCFLVYFVNAIPSKWTENLSVIAYKNSKALENISSEPFAVKMENLKSEYNLVILFNANLRIISKNLVDKLEKVEFLQVYSFELQNIEQEAFAKSTFKRIEIKNTQLKKLERKSFNEMSNIEEISLEDAPIETIEDEAFSRLPKLKAVKLVQNKLTHIKSTWFVNCPNLYKIDFSFNKIKKLPAFNFLSAHNPHVIILSYNNIQEIESGTFPSKKISILKLDGNHLSNITKAVFPYLKTGGQLDLSNNRIECLKEVKRGINGLFTEVLYDDNPVAFFCTNVNGKLNPIGF